jgi:hypothetical protein
MVSQLYSQRIGMVELVFGNIRHSIEKLTKTDLRRSNAHWQAGSRFGEGGLVGLVKLVAPLALDAPHGRAFYFGRPCSSPYFL